MTAPTTVGVEGLAANTAATLFTGADSSFDVSKVSSRPARNGVLMGTAAATTLSGTDVVTAGVAAYDATAWIEPYIAAKALIWLDASDAANFEFKDNTFGFVTTWKDKSSYKRDATAYTIASHEPNWGTLSVTNGVPAYCMGACDSGIDLAFSVRMTKIRTVFWAMSICQDSRAFFLGDSSTYRFHRGGNGQYCYNNNNAIWKNGKIYCDGVLVTDNLNTLVPTDRHVYFTVTAANCESNRLTLDRASGSSIRHAGRELSELIAFDTALSDTDRNAIEAYLAAKWMGSNPTAARSDDTFIYKSDYTVDGNVGGGKNLNFEEGASVTVVNPSASEPMIATTGTVTIPSGSPLAVNVDATALVPSTYTVMQAGSGITSLSQFAPTATVGAGASATFAVVDGKLTMTIAVSSSVTSQTWRPASAADLGWNTTSANWLYDGGTTGGFIPYVPAFIDGTESASGDITVSGSMFAGPITLTGPNDYTFKGTGTIAGGDTVTFGGTGTITLDGANFGDQEIVITNGQKVVLGFNAAANALGTDSGSSGGNVVIGGGGQFNINYTDLLNGNNSPRAEITTHKTFVIAGDGPDGRGAIVNDSLDGRTSHGYYNALLRRVELADDATIGGTDRIDMRVHTGPTSATATPGIYGPGKTLTVKTNIFCPYGQPIDVESIVVKPGAELLPAYYTDSIQCDGLTLQVRPTVNACVWKWINAKPVASTWNTVGNWTHIKCIDSVAQMHLSGTGPTTDTAGLYSGKINVFEGWFKVEDGKEGSWSFKLAYDDYHLLKIDGVQLLGRSSSTETKTGSTTLTAGWHRWEVRVSDGGGGGWGPNNINGGMTLSYQAPGESAYSRFDETNLKLAATLGDIAVLEPTGIYKELELGAGSTLTSSGTMAMPIFGTLKGTGTLAGAFEFAGTTNCWEVANAVATTAELPAATFAAATPATFAGLKSVRVLFDAKPSRHTYFLTGAINGLTATDIPAAAVTVKDADDGDYSTNFTLTVKNGRLALSNSKAGGTFIIVR